jgi:hypothetical protein
MNVKYMNVKYRVHKEGGRGGYTKMNRLSASRPPRVLDYGKRKGKTHLLEEQRGSDKVGDRLSAPRAQI